MFKSSFSEIEINEKLLELQETDVELHESLLNQIECSKLQRLKQSTKQIIKSYLVRELKGPEKKIKVKELISFLNQPSPKRKVLYIGSTPTLNLVRQSLYLRKTGKYETILLTGTPWLGDFMEKCFDALYVYGSYYELAHMIKKVEPYITHVQGSVFHSEYLGVLAKLLGKPKVVFEFYDIGSLSVSKDDAIKVWGKADTELGLLSEKFVCKKCDGIILGYSPEAWETLKRAYHTETPMLEFHSYVCDDFISNEHEKYSRIDSNIHIVYGGQVISSRSSAKIFRDTQFHSLIERITAQGIYYDIYTSPYISPWRFKRKFDDYIRLSEKNPLFKFQKGLPLDKATKAFSKYDFGAMINPFDRESTLAEHLRTRIPVKFFTYLEAGLPILVSEELQYVAKLVKEYEIGIIVSQKDLDRLREIIDGYDLDKLNANVKVAQKELSMDKHINRLIGFYESVVGDKT